MPYGPPSSHFPPQHGPQMQPHGPPMHMPPHGAQLTGPALAPGFGAFPSPYHQHHAPSLGAVGFDSRQSFFAQPPPGFAHPFFAGPTQYAGGTLAPGVVLPAFGPSVHSAPLHQPAPPPPPPPPQPAPVQSRAGKGTGSTPPVPSGSTVAYDSEFPALAPSVVGPRAGRRGK